MTDRQQSFTTITIGADWLKIRLDEIEEKVDIKLNEALLSATTGTIEEALYKMVEAISLLLDEQRKLALDMVRQ